MILHERHKKIMDLLFCQGIVYTSDLKEKFGTSFETIRKDLQYLEKEGLVKRVHGGAVPAGEPEKDDAAFPTLPLPDDFLKRLNNNREQKQQIARKACGFIKEKSCIALDAGTTAYELTLILMERFNSLTIITNSMINALMLSKKPDFTVIVTGGVVSHREKALVTNLTDSLLHNINIDIMFLTTCGIDINTGIAEQTLDEIAIHKAMAKRSKQLILLADSTKFFRSALFHAYGFDEVSAIITDDRLSDETAEEYRKKDVPIIIA